MDAVDYEKMSQGCQTFFLKENLIQGTIERYLFTLLRDIYLHCYLHIEIYLFTFIFQQTSRQHTHRVFHLYKAIDQGISSPPF